MIVVVVCLWIVRVLFLLLASLLAGDIFNNTYGSDDYDVEPKNILVLFFLVQIYLFLEVILQIILRRTRWFIVVGHVFLTIFLSLVTVLLMDWHYKRLPICNRSAACARQPGSPYDESQIPEREPSMQR